MKLITLTTTTFLALLTRTALAWDTSISEREDPYTQLKLLDNISLETIAEIELQSAWQNNYCTNILSFRATRIEVDRWNCGTQKCTVFFSTDCSGAENDFFDRPSDYAVAGYSADETRPWGSVLCQWGDSSSCRPETKSESAMPSSVMSAFVTSAAASTPKTW
jgi:hypothetical protein